MIKIDMGMRPMLNGTGNGTGADLMSLEHLPLVEDLESIDLLCPLHLHHLGGGEQGETGRGEMSSLLNTH